MQLHLIRHQSEFFVYKLETLSPETLEIVRGQNDFWSLTISPKETSLVTSLELQQFVQSKEGPWTLYEVDGPLDFSLTGILVRLTKPLADARISIFAISSHDTDFILVNSELASKAEETWEQSEFKVSKL